MANDDIAALIAAGKITEARIAISAARREGQLSGSEARALGKLADDAPKPVRAVSGKRR